MRPSARGQIRKAGRTTSKRKSALPPEDDGRTIANMNVEGMPWYTPSPDAPPQTDMPAPEPMAREDRRRYILGAVLAALAVAAVFGLAVFLFISFCDFVWFQ